MKKQELMKKGLAFLISGTILMAGCASKASNPNLSQQAGNTDIETEGNIPDNNEKSNGQGNNTSNEDDSGFEDETRLQEDIPDKKSSQENDDGISEASEHGGSEDGSSALIDIESGDLYEAIQSIDPSLKLQDADSGKYLSVTMEKSDEDVDSKKTMQRFFWDAVQFLKTESFKGTYDSVHFTFLGKDSLESFNVGKFESFDNFTTTYIGPLSPIENNYFPAFYKLIFSTRDVSVAAEKSMYDLSKKYGTEGFELPDNYQEGYLWYFSNFDYGYGCSFDEKAITLTIPVLNTAKCGEETGAVVFSALEEFYTLSYGKPEAFPYDSLTILCVDLANTIVWTFVTDKSTGDWDITKNTASGDFLTGLQSYRNSKTTDGGSPNNSKTTNPSNNEPSTPEESANAPEATPETPIPAEPSADMVWIDDTGKKYHSKSSCSNMSDPYQITRQEAEAMGRGACKKCY
ncbi:MAG: hypothetical protein HFH40_00520 [Lachnospiraceae bacterium]|nr:hypothetical protein [Lachnospiraceae bacterium]